MDKHDKAAIGTIYRPDADVPLSDEPCRFPITKYPERKTAIFDMETRSTEFLVSPDNPDARRVNEGTFEVTGTVTGRFEPEAVVPGEAPRSPHEHLKELIGNMLLLYKGKLLPAEMSDVLQYHQDYLADRLDREEPR